MNFETHLGAGLFAGSGALYLTNAPPEQWPLALFCAGVASLAPDIDHGNASLNNEIKRSVPILGTVVNTILKMIAGEHRTRTHSFIAIVLLALALKTFFPGMELPLFLAILAGYTSHLVVDQLNLEGVSWLWPIHTKFALPLPWPFIFRSGSRIEVYLYRPLMWVGTGWVIWLAVQRGSGVA